MSQKANPDDNTLYQTTASSVFQAEDIRWTRFYHFLVLESILAVAWGVAFNNDYLRSHPELLTIICTFGIVFGIQWAVLGYRSSRFVQVFHTLAQKMEGAAQGPFNTSEDQRKKHWGIFKSTVILVEVPILFAMLFSVFIWVSWDIQPGGCPMIVSKGVNTMELVVQWAQVIGTLALLVTLGAVIIYTKSTKAMAKATEALAKAEDKNIEFRERPIVRFVVGEKVPVVSVDAKTRQHIIETKRPFDFPTEINNTGIVHAKVRVKATVLHNDVELKFPKDNLYQGEQTMKMQAGTGINGHLSLPDLFRENTIEVQTEAQAKDSPIFYNDRELLVRLESKVINYYKPESDFANSQSKNPPAYYRWKGQFAIGALGSWIPEYAVEDFDDFPEME